MAADLDPPTLLRFVTGDFQTAWDAVAGLPGPASRGNFMFAKQAMVLLELACRICSGDQSGAALADFGKELNARDPRYFWKLPGPVWAPGPRSRNDFALPTFAGIDPHDHLLAAIFNLIRNGQAHQYQQMRAVLSDGTDFWISLTGAAENYFLSSIMAGGRPADHLSHRDAGGDIWITVRPDVLFLDVRDAVNAARLGQRNLTLRYLVEDRTRTFGFDRAALKASLEQMNK